MNPTRRTFLQAIPIIGFIVASPRITLANPWRIIRPEPQRYLTTRFNEFARGSGTKHWPVDIQAGRDLFDKYEGSLQCLQRFTTADPIPGPPVLMFKSAKMYRGPHSGWGLTLTDKTGRTMTWRDEDARL